jgi:hypothetical protein
VNWPICGDLSEGYVLYSVPESFIKARRGGVEKIRYRNVEALVAGLKVLRVEDETIANLRQSLEERAPFTISEIPQPPTMISRASRSCFRHPFCMEEWLSES